jgi:hypothetical protein
MVKPNPLAVIAKAAQKGGPKKSKSKTPQIALPKHEEAIKTWLEAHSDEKNAKARKADAELEFLPDAEVARLGECRRDGKYYSSVKVNNGADSVVTVSVQNRYKEIPTDSWSELEAVFGEDDTERHFASKTTIVLTDAALNDNAILAKLVAAVGEEQFQTYFDVKQFVAPTNAFHEARATDPEVGKKAQKLIDSGVLQPYKSAVKVG